MPRKSEPTIGDNSVNAKELRAFVERVEQVNSEIAAWKEDIKEILLEARVKGFDPKQMKRIIRTRAMDAEKRKAEEEIYDSYLAALGIL